VSGGPILSSPAVANGVVYIGSDNHYVHSIGLAGGLATPSRCTRNSLHPDYRLPQDRQKLSRPACEAIAGDLSGSCPPDAAPDPARHPPKTRHCSTQKRHSAAASEKIATGIIGIPIRRPVRV
jgi:hypothetical protein